MARSSDRDDPLSAVRHLLRDVRTTPPTLDAWRRADLLGAVEIALYRLPPREREVVRRYDLAGERAQNVQQALGLSPRQFFRDRRRGLAVLNAHLCDEGAHSSEHCGFTGEGRAVTLGNEAEAARRTFARSLSQSGNARCLDVLQELAGDAPEPLTRVDLLLELAETAADYSDDAAAAEAIAATSRILSAGGYAPAISDWLRGRLAQLEGRLAETPREGSAHFARAASLLRRSIAADPIFLEARAALANTLGDEALLCFASGDFAPARAASSEAAAIIGAFQLSKRPKALEILAMHAAIVASLSGRTRAAIRDVASLLRHAADSGWSSTASRLGAVLVGLHGVSGEYGEAIRWYRNATPLAGARAGDRANLTMEAAHAYTMVGRPNDALSILGYIRPGEGCPRAEVPGWHALVAAAQQRLGENAAALAEAREALAGYAAQRTERGIADAHRLIATCQAQLGKMDAAREHLTEARRLTERHGTPYALLRTLTAEAAILRTATIEREAMEYARLLHSLAAS